jgi:type III secretion system FlhB-like substrate exporter
MPLQRHLFLKEMRMSRTELKRERKDTDGNPLIKSERRRIQSMLAKRKVRKGVRHAAVVIAHEDRVVGLRYHREEAPVPLIVSKGRGQAGDEMLAEARRLGIPVVEDASMVDQLIGHAIGDRIPQETYTPVARLLVRFGLCPSFTPEGTCRTVSYFKLAISRWSAYHARSGAQAFAYCTDPDTCAIADLHQGATADPPSVDHDIDRLVVQWP